MTDREKTEISRLRNCKRSYTQTAQALNTSTNTGANEGIRVPISEKYMLTIREASAYFNLGVKHLRRLAEENTDTFAVHNGSRCLIIRPKFEKFLDESATI